MSPLWGPLKCPPSLLLFQGLTNNMAHNTLFLNSIPYFHLHLGRHQLSYHYRPSCQQRLIFACSYGGWLASISLAPCYLQSNWCKHTPTLWLCVEQVTQTHTHSSCSLLNYRYYTLCKTDLSQVFILHWKLAASLVTVSESCTYTHACHCCLSL